MNKALVIDILIWAVAAFLVFRLVQLLVSLP